jgi:hypothetical protein
VVEYGSIFYRSHEPKGFWLFSQPTAFQKPQLTAAFQKPRLNQTGPKNCSDNAPITNDLIPAVTPFIIPTGN